jgi:hypothetical protein
MTAPINDSDNIKPSRLNRRRRKKWRVQCLTSITPAVMIRSHSQKTSVGFGSPFSQGAEAMRRKSRGFFYAQNPSSMAGGVLGGRKACRILDPVYQPATSSAAQSLVAPRGGLTTVKESIMTNQDQAQNAPKILGQIPPKPTQQPEAVNDFLRQIRNLEIERQAVTKSGVPALIRLAEIAEGDTGQAATVRRFLVGLYNGYRFPFNLITLRGLDNVLFDDCMAVLKLDARATNQEVHEYFDNGGELFERFAGMMEG